MWHVAVGCITPTVLGSPKREQQLPPQPTCFRKKMGCVSSNALNIPQGILKQRRQGGWGSERGHYI